jgi:hypothetical protein
MLAQKWVWVVKEAFDEGEVARVAAVACHYQGVAD